MQVRNSLASVIYLPVVAGEASNPIPAQPLVHPLVLCSREKPSVHKQNVKFAVLWGRQVKWFDRRIASVLAGSGLELTINIVDVVGLPKGTAPLVNNLRIICTLRPWSDKILQEKLSPTKWEKRLTSTIVKFCMARYDGSDLIACLPLHRSR